MKNLPKGFRPMLACEAPNFDKIRFPVFLGFRHKDDLGE